jgi:hypothetical protein
MRRFETNVSYEARSAYSTP